MNKVGLVVVTYKDNFGSALQTYATQYIINKLGFETEIFDIKGVNKKVNIKKLLYYSSRIFNTDENCYLLNNVVSRLRKKTNFANDVYARNMQIRHQAYEKFNCKWFKFMPQVESWKELIEQSIECSHVVVGSDQLWRPSNIAGGYFTLEFVPENVHKIAYSTSFGVSEIPKSLWKHSKRFLNRIENISVREESGRGIIMELTGRDVPVVCDPTMMLDVNEWEGIQEKEVDMKDKYILTYFMGSNQKHRDFVKRLKKETGLKIIGLLHGATYIKEDEGFADEEPYNVGPSEFIKLIREAEFICTDSFHGTVFSILYGKKFFSFRRYEDKSKFSTNDRLFTLLKWTGLEDRMLYGTEYASRYVELTYDLEEVEERLKEKRNMALNYLEYALGIG